MTKVYFEAYACDDYGDGPTFAELDVTPEFCARLQYLAALGAEHKLSELRVSGTFNRPDAWGPGDIEQELRFTMPELVVAGGWFWFTDHPKHSTYNVETRSVEVAGFCDAVAKHEGSDPLFFGNDLEELRRHIADVEEEVLV